MNVRFLTTENEIAARWEHIAPHIAPVVKGAAHGEFTVDDLRAGCLEGRMIAGICEYGGAVTMAMIFEFRHYPQMVAVNVIALGGADLDTVAQRYFPRFQVWAREAGATVIEASCSRTMARLLHRYGFTDTYQQVRLPV